MQTTKEQETVFGNLGRSKSESVNNTINWERGTSPKTKGDSRNQIISHSIASFFSHIISGSILCKFSEIAACSIPTA